LWSECKVYNPQFGDLFCKRIGKILCTYFFIYLSESELPRKDLSSGSYSRPLPLELNCEIFECLKLPVQRKFICGLGRRIYGISRQKVLKKFFFKYRNAQKLSPNKDHVTLECQRQFCSHNIVKTSLNKLFWQWAYTTKHSRRNIINNFNAN
jgi:hypothetical protein